MGYFDSRSLCQSCTAPTRGHNDTLCAKCWPRVAPSAKREYLAILDAVSIRQRPYEDMRMADAVLVRSVANHETGTMTMATASRTCTECAKDFTHTPGIGRPPFRCPACRGDQAKRPAPTPPPTPTNGNGTHALVPAKRAAVVKVATASVPSGDIATMRAAVQAEIQEIERALAVRLRLVRAIDEYNSTEGVFSGEATEGATAR